MFSILLICDFTFFRYRFTAIAVHPQVQSITSEKKYDIIYVGTGMNENKFYFP